MGAALFDHFHLLPYLVLGEYFELVCRNPAKCALGAGKCVLHCLQGTQEIAITNGAVTSG